MDDFEKKLFLIGQNIAKYRKKKNISTKELSVHTDIREQYIKRIEQGAAKRVSIDQIALISEVLEIPVYKIFEY